MAGSIIHRLCVSKGNYLAAVWKQKIGTEILSWDRGQFLVDLGFQTSSATLKNHQELLQNFEDLVMVASQTLLLLVGSPCLGPSFLFYTVLYTVEKDFLFRCVAEVSNP